MSARRVTVLQVIDVAKDLTLFAVGLLLIYRQGWLVPRADFNWIPFAFGVVLTQAPGGMAAISLLRTGGGSSSAVPDAPLPPLPSPLPSAGADPS